MPVTFEEEKATSFGSVAESYDRVRPGPAPAALDWLVPDGCQVAVDLAAGTGLFTRELLDRVDRVVAVEPDLRMREVLAARSPELDVREGWGESMPLPDASADAVFVSTAWHWLDPVQAVPEIARVLRPGGRLGVVWTTRDRDQDWVAELDLLRLPGINDQTGGGPRTVEEVRAELDRHHTVALPDGAEFADQETASFGFTRMVSIDDALAWLASNSAFITASAADRAVGLASCRDALERRAGDGSEIEMPLRSACWRARRSLSECARYREVLVITKTVRRRVSGQRKPYHLHVATEYGAYGDQPWRDAEPQYPGQPAHGGGPSQRGAQQPEPPPPGRRHRHRTPASIVIATIALVLGLIGLVISLIGVVTQLMPRTFTAGQQRQITDWEYGRTWRTLSAGQIFPASITYQAPDQLEDSALTLTARRIGVARQSSCKAATDAAAAAVLADNGCSAMLRATYADGTDSYVVTVGVAVLPSTAQATEASDELSDAARAGGILPGVHALAFKNSPAAWFTDPRRQLTGSDQAGTYVALYAVGYTDSRPREPVSSDRYADQEMTTAGAGVAQAVLSEVGASVKAPHCPGTPGC
jgi:SAM-dependent methyltransferase